MYVYIPFGQVSFQLNLCILNISIIPVYNNCKGMRNMMLPKRFFSPCIRVFPWWCWVQRLNWFFWGFEKRTLLSSFILLESLFHLECIILQQDLLQGALKVLLKVSSLKNGYIKIWASLYLGFLSVVLTSSIGY